MTQDLKTGIVIGIIIGAILGGWYQQVKAADRLADQVKDGFFYCHSQLHPNDDMLTWMDEPTDLYIQHDVVQCGWVGDTFQ